MFISKKILVKISTFKKVSIVCVDFNDTWNVLTGFAQICNDFEMHLGKIIQVLPKDLQTTAGSSSEKKKIHNSASVLGTDILDMMFVMATVTSNDDLLTNVKKLHKDIYHCSDEEFVGICKNIHELGTKNLAATASYGLTDAKLNAFKTEYENFEIFISVILEEISINQEAYSSLVFHVLECSKDLILMKKLMSNFKTTHQFYERFFIAAKYESYGYKQLSFLGYVTNLATNKPVAGASIVLTNNLDIELHLKSSASGKITIRRQPENIYYMSITKIGMQPIINKQILIEDEITNDDEIYMEPMV